MWHIETDIFALAVFVIMLIRYHLYRKQNSDIQTWVFYFVLVFSTISNIIDIVSSAAMNFATNWWLYQITMTVYVMSMPLVAAIWVCYAYITIHKNDPVKKIKRNLTWIIIPYIIYALVAASNPFTGLFFHLTNNIEYSRGILFMPVGVGSIMVYSAVGLIIVLVHCRQIKPTINALLLMTFFITTAVFIWVQLANPGWLIINASYAVVYIWCDITIEEQRRQKLYKEIQQKHTEPEAAVTKAEATTQAKTEFLSRMSHDIRTPMNAIIGLTHLAKDENDVRIIHDYLYNIESASDFLLGLINDILDMSKIENGDLKLKEETFTRDEFVNSITTVIKPLMDKRGINFIFTINSSYDCIKTDKLRFNQIFFNLLSNASKFTPAGGTVEFITQDMPEHDGLVGLKFIVRDTGVGMSPEFIPHMYEAFSQEHSSLSDNKAPGTGLGLPIVKSLVDAMGGTISVKSELNKGTEFTINLSFSPADPESTVVKPDSVNRKNLKGAHILLVEDNEINVYVARIILERVECDITVAINGQEALDVFNDSKPGYFDAILMDVRMPVMDGITATEHIRALKRPDAATVPIIAMTADAFEEEQKRTLAAGMNYHLSKPIDPSLLYHVLSTYLIN